MIAVNDCDSRSGILISTVFAKQTSQIFVVVCQQIDSFRHLGAIFSAHSSSADILRYNKNSVVYVKHSMFTSTSPALFN